MIGDRLTHEMTLEEMKAKRDALQRRLEWLGLKSSGSDKLEAQIRRLDRMIALAASGSA